MKLASYSNDGAKALGLVRGESIYPLAEAIPHAPSDMMALIAQWDVFQAACAAIPTTATYLPLGEVTLLAPVPRPAKIMAIGLNYADHIAETGRDPPEHQVWFAKLVNTINAPFGNVEIPVVSTAIDYEVELVAVIGKPGRNIAAADAYRHIFGYCVGNDITVRDWQRQTPQWILGKSFDTHAPIGPWITTAEEIGDPHRLGIRCFVNGQLRQNSNTGALVFDLCSQIEHLSKAMTLEPGDLIFSGTPGGVGWAMKPPRVLVAGDRVRCEIDELGAIENVMVPQGRAIEAADQ